MDERKDTASRFQDVGDLRTITDVIRQPIVVLAPDGTTLYANRVALELTHHQEANEGRPEQRRYNVAGVELPSPL